MLQTCFDQLNINGSDLKDIKLEPIFASIFRYILNKPNFSTVLCQSVRNTALSEDLLENLCTALQLSELEKIGIGLSLSDSENLDIRICGISISPFYLKFLKWCNLFVLFPYFVVSLTCEIYYFNKNLLGYLQVKTSSWLISQKYVEVVLLWILLMSKFRAFSCSLTDQQALANMLIHLCRCCR